ncbi:hypothetical protein Tco_1299285, partial [Tanacetum coccineum]
MMESNKQLEDELHNMFYRAEDEEDEVGALVWHGEIN